MTGRVILLRLIMIAGTCLVLAACGGSPGPSAYLYSDSSGVGYIQYQPGQGDAVHGTFTEDNISGTAPQESVSVTSVPFTGTLDGGNLTITMSGAFGLGGSLNGTIDSGTLTFETVGSGGSIQQTPMRAADDAEYNAAVAVLRRQVGRANAQAAAAQAQAAQQQQVAQDEQTASTDLATLQSDASFGSDLSALVGDVKGENGDLAAERRAAARGLGADCYNLQENVDYDAQQNVDYDLQQNVDYDLQQNLRPDIATARRDIRTVRADLATLAGEQAQQPGQVSLAISEAHGAIRDAIKTANGYVDQANADDAQAYSVANAAATGACSGDTIGSPPAPVGHIH